MTWETLPIENPSYYGHKYNRFKSQKNNSTRISKMHVFKVHVLS